MHRETRVFSLNALRADGDDAGARKFSGHASVFNQLSSELWGFYERVAPGAFDTAIAGVDDVRFLINHDPSLLLARNKSGTLTLSKDDEGLVAEAELPDTSYARDLAESMDREDIDQMSFGFRTVEDSWDEEDAETDDGDEVKIQVRTLEQVELFDVSVVTFPAYPDTDAELNAAAYRYLGCAPAWHRSGGVLIPTAIPGSTVPVATTDTTNVTEVRIDVDTTSLKEAIARVAELGEGLEELTGEREGKVLSKQNLELVDGVITSLQALKDAAVPAAAEPEDEQNAIDPAVATAIRRRQIDIAELELPTPHELRR